MLGILLGLSLGRMQLPWALTSLIQTSGVPPEGGGHASEPASARDAGGSMRRDAGTSAIASILIVKARSAAGRPGVARPNAAKPRKSKPNTPRPNTRAVNKPSRRRKPPRAWKLRPRVVTRQKNFRCRSAIGRAAMNRPRPRFATPPVIAAALAGKQSATSWTVNASGSRAAL